MPDGSAQFSDVPHEWTRGQQLALDRFGEWFKVNKDTPAIFRLFGYAGTGKTTVAKHLAASIEGKVIYGAFSGKAAVIMQKAGCTGAATIHSIIYRPVGGEAEANKLVTKLQEEKDPLKRKDLMRDIETLLNPKFVLNLDGPLSEADLFIIDECSMVNAEMLKDILAFKKPLLVLGDPGQLPPVSGEGALTTAEPDVMLDEVRRQALDSPVLKLATDARLGRKTPFGRYGDSAIVQGSIPDESFFENHDQVICGFNKNRLVLNSIYRELHSFHEEFPVETERLICLRNERSKGLLNGEMFSVEEFFEERNLGLRMQLKSLDREGNPLFVNALAAYFQEYAFPGALQEINAYTRNNYSWFDFAYAVTCHKAQGSQWPSVFVFYDGFGWKEADVRRAWIYTAITRAGEKVTLMRKS